jgi:hypothetical protein
MASDSLRIVRDLYRGVEGWDIPVQETRRIVAARSAETYGEIMPTATARLLDYLGLGRRDVLYDLGCGIGKLVVHAAVSLPLRGSVGIEMSATRSRLAHAAAARAADRGLVRAQACAIRCQDFMRAKLDDATVVYTCSTAFPGALMIRLARKLARLPRPIRFVTLQDLDPHPAFELVDVLQLDMTWRRRAKVHVYTVTPRAFRGC